MDLSTTLLIIVLAIQLLTSLFLFIGKQWIENKFKLEFNKSLALFNNDLLIKQKSELIAELIAEWLSNSVDNKKLHELTFQAFLWLPKDIALDLSNTLSHAADAKGAKEILADVRVLLLGEDERIDANEIISFKGFRMTPRI